MDYYQFREFIDALLGEEIILRFHYIKNDEPLSGEIEDLPVYVLDKILNEARKAIKNEMV